MWGIDQEIINDEMEGLGMVREIKQAGTVDVLKIANEVNQAVIDATFNMTAAQERAWWAELDMTIKKECE